MKSIVKHIMLVLALGIIIPSAWAQETAPETQESENKGFVVDKIISKVDNYIVSGLPDERRLCFSTGALSVSRASHP
jgi:hypothetical protein